MEMRRDHLTFFGCVLWRPMSAHCPVGRNYRIVVMERKGLGIDLNEYGLRIRNRYYSF